MNSSTGYQVGVLITSKGKRVAASKRRIRWRFGFADREAMEQGKTGQDCRGEEHEVVFVWSYTSGKQLVLVDGNEVHFSKGSYTDKFECSWICKQGRQFTVVAHATSALFQSSGSNQFDLIIDGHSYWNMPKMIELGYRGSGISTRARSCPQLRRPQQDYLSSPAASTSTSVRCPLSLRVVPVGDLLSDSTPVVSPQVTQFATPIMSPFSFQGDFNHSSTPINQQTTYWQPQHQAVVTPDSSSVASSQTSMPFSIPQHFVDPSQVGNALESLVDLDIQESARPLDKHKAHMPEKQPNKKIMCTHDLNGMLVACGSSLIQQPGMCMRTIFAQ